MRKSFWGKLGMLLGVLLLGQGEDMHGSCRFKNARVIELQGIVERDLYVDKGRVVEPCEGFEEIDLEGARVSAGLIDLQINGAFGVDFSQNGEDVEEVARSLVAHGVTAFLPTVVSSPLGQYPIFLENLAARRVTGGAEILGIHMEGPCLAPAKKGAHDSDVFILPSHEEELGFLFGARVVTLAPEMDGGQELVNRLSMAGVRVALGHTEASLEEVLGAVDSGASWVTHLFNAMPGLHHRSPGVLGAVLGDKACSFSLIADGVHVHPTVVRLACSAHPEGVILVTDAMAAMGLGEGDYFLGELDVEVRDGRAFLKGTTTLAGSVLQLDEAVRNIMRFTGCNVETAVAMASLRPAQALGLDRKGHLGLGADADFVVWDEQMRPMATFVAGDCVWRAKD